MDREQEVRRLAYELWKQEGEPDGYEESFWQRAEREVLRRRKRPVATQTFIVHEAGAAAEVGA
jgi:hypothetical protein